jgi:LPS export ABC transporter protein LptC
MIPDLAVCVLGFNRHPENEIRLRYCSSKYLTIRLSRSALPSPFSGSLNKRWTLAEKKKKTLWVCLLAVLILGGIVLIVSAQFGVENKIPPVVSMMGDSKFLLGRIRQTATHDGVKQWLLDAESAKYLDDGNRTLLKKIEVTFFLKNAEQVLLTADEGILHNDSNDMEALGNVIVTSESGSLTTQEMYYDNAKKLLTCDSPVWLKGVDFDIEADLMRFDLKSNRTYFNGNVKGLFNYGLAF